MSGVDGQGAGAGAAITLEGVSVFYGDVMGLSDVSARFEAGVTGIVGPNGSGKTTLMRLLTGLKRPREGAVRVLGGAPFDDPAIRARVAFVPTVESFYEDVGAGRNLELAFRARGLSAAAAREAAHAALSLIDLVEPAKRPYGTWSRGMRQRLKLAVALHLEQPVVLLDEPFLGVDPPNRVRMKELVLRLGAAGRTVLVSSHVLDEIETLTDRVAIFSHGRLLRMGRRADIRRELAPVRPERIAIASSDPRALARALFALDGVVAGAIEGDTLHLVVWGADAALAALPALLVSEGIVVRSLRAEDESLAALFAEVTASGAGRLNA